MSRPLRIEYAGGLYHVMNRGNQRLEVFSSKRDCETFLEKLSLFAETYKVDIYCYCLMPNHFHLLLRTRAGNLGKFMQVMLTSFTMTINRRKGKTGHLFHGRYKAQLVESRKYLSVLSRYIHLNPIRVKKLQSLPVLEKKRLLGDYPWSSYRACVGLMAWPDFLKIDAVLSSWGKELPEQMKAYRAYVENGLYKGINNPFDLAIRQQIIGSETFAEKIARERLLKRTVKDVKEDRELLKASQVIPPDEIITLTAGVFATTVAKVLARKGKHRQARKVAMFLCCQHCVSKYSLTEIGKRFSVSISGLTKRDMVKYSDDQILIKKISEVEAIIKGR